MRLELADLTVDFGRTRVLDSVNLLLESGSLVVVQGENGAGKSTLLWAISGLLLPSGGAITLNDGSGVEPCIGFLSHQSFLYEELTAFENLVLTARLHGLSDPEDRAREALAGVGMADHAAKRVSDLSRGQQQRVAFARAVLPAPGLLLLDEPFSNLDTAGTELLSRVLESMQSPPVSPLIILATHDAALCRRFSPRVLNLKAGRVSE